MITEFLTYKKKIQNVADGTVTEYGKNLRAFATWVNINHPGTTWTSVTKQLIEAHMIALHDAKLKPRTITLRLAAIRSLYNWMITQGMMKNNPARYIQTPKAGSTLPQTCAIDALSKYMAKAATSQETKEVQALIAILVETGMRLQEALDVRPSDINKTEMSIVVNGKGNKQRKVYYGEMTRQKMNALAATVNTAKGFFQHDQRWYRETMSEEMKGTINYIHPHMLRHTYATQLLTAGAQLKYVSELLGHESVKTTERYTHAVNNEVAKTAKTMAPRLQFQD